MQKIAWIAGLVLLSGCGVVGDSQQVRNAKDAAAAALRDPASAQFRNVRPSGDYVCGEVNGKNAYGAYAGFDRFVVTPDGVAVMEPSDAAEQAEARGYFEVLWATCPT